MIDGAIRQPPAPTGCLAALVRVSTPADRIADLPIMRKASPFQGRSALLKIELPLPMLGAPTEARSIRATSRHTGCCMRRHIKRWSRPFLSADRASLWISADFDDGSTADLELPFGLVDQLISAFAQAGEHASREAGDDANAQPDFSHGLEAVPVRGLGFSTGRHAGETILIVDFFRFQLALLLDSKKVADLGQSFARTAAMLSADPSKKM